MSSMTSQSNEPNLPFNILAVGSKENYLIYFQNYRQYINWKIWLVFNNYINTGTVIHFRVIDSISNSYI